MPSDHMDTAQPSELARAIRTACCCLKSLRIRVEARSNVTERAVRRRQLQLMQASVQPHHTEDPDTAFFFPPVWPIRTRHGPYNSVSGEKHLEKGLVWSKNAGKSSYTQTENQKTQPKTTRKSPSQICVSP